MYTKTMGIITLVAFVVMFVEAWAIVSWVTLAALLIW